MMSDLLDIVSNTAEIPLWFMTDQVDETFESVMKEGCKGLKGYVEEMTVFNANTPPCESDDVELNGNSVNLERVDWEIAYLIIRDWSKKELWRTIGESHVCDYMGLNHDDLNDWSKPSPSVKAKFFGAKSLSKVSNITNIPLRTLNDWFETRKIAFHCAVEFTARK